MGVSFIMSRKNSFLAFFFFLCVKELTPLNKSFSKVSIFVDCEDCFYSKCFCWNVKKICNATSLTVKFWRSEKFFEVFSRFCFYFWSSPKCVCFFFNFWKTWRTKPKSQFQNFV
jgi:hypothetical protein